jgi:hypothetical protein
VASEIITRGRLSAVAVHRPLVEQISRTLLGLCQEELRLVRRERRALLDDLETAEALVLEQEAARVEQAGATAGATSSIIARWRGLRAAEVGFFGSDWGGTRWFVRQACEAAVSR